MEFEQFSRPHFNMGQYVGAPALDMSSMAAALPDYQMRQFQQQSFPQHYQTPGLAGQSMMYQYQQGAQFAGQAAGNYLQSFAQQYPTQYAQSPQPRQQQGAYPQFVGSQGGPGGPQAFQNQAFMLQQPPFSTPNTTSRHQQHHQQGPYLQPHGNPSYAGTYPAKVGSFPLPQLRLDSSLAQPQGANYYSQPNIQREYRNPRLFV